MEERKEAITKPLLWHERILYISLASAYLAILAAHILCNTEQRGILQILIQYYLPLPWYSKVEQRRLGDNEQ